MRKNYVDELAGKLWDTLRQCQLIGLRLEPGAGGDPTILTLAFSGGTIITIKPDQMQDYSAWLDILIHENKNGYGSLGADDEPEQNSD